MQFVLAMGPAMQKFLLILAVTAPPVSGLGLYIRDLHRNGLAARMDPLFPEGSVPGPSIDLLDWNRTHEILSAYVDTPDVEFVTRLCNIDGSETDMYFHVENPGLESFALERPPSRAAVIVTPGGGHDFLAWDKEGTSVAQWLNSLGISAFVVKYRVPSKRRPWINTMDVQRALSTVRSRADALAIDTDRIGVIGFSAGGDIVTRVAVANARSYQRIDEIDDVPSKPNFQLLVYPSIFLPVLPGQQPPPTFMAHAADDPCVPALVGMTYCMGVRLVAHQNCTEFLYPRGGHGMGVCNGRWQPDFPHEAKERGYDGSDGFYNTWSGDDMCEWMDEAKKWFLETGIIESQ